MTPGRKILLLAFILLPVLLVAIYSFYETRKQLITGIHQERRMMASLASNVLEEKLDRLADIGLALSTRPVFCSLINDGKWQQAIQLMQNVPAAFPYIRQVLISDTVGTLKAGSPEISGAEKIHQASFDWFKGVTREWKSYLSEVSRSADLPHAIITTLALPVKNSDGKRIGIMVLKVNVERLLEWSGDVSIGKSSFVTVVDQKGHIASSPDYPQRDSIIDYSTVPAVQKALNGEKRVEVSFNPVANQSRLSAYQPVPRYNWAIIVQQEAAAALPIWNSLWIIILFYGLVILVAIALAVYIIHEIDRRKTSETQLRKSEETSRLLIENVKDYAIFMLDVEGKIASWNSGAEVIKGYKSDEVMGQSLEIFYTKADLLKGVPQNNLRMARENGSYEDFGWRIRKDGSKFWADVVFTALYDKDNTIKGYAEVARDITEKRNAEEQLSTLATLVNQSTDAIMSLDMEGRLVTWNKGSELLYGHTEQEALGKKATELGIHKLNTGEIKCLYETVSRNGYWEKEMDFYRKDGTSFFGAVKASPIKNRDGITTSFVFIEKDISLRKQLEEKLQKYNEELETEIVARTAEVLKTERRFRVLFENNYDIISLIDESFNLIYRSPSAQRVTGWTNEDLMNTSAIDKIHPDDQEIAKEIVINLMTNPGKPIPTLFRSRHKNGEYIWFEGIANNLLSDKIVNAIVFNFRDVTERIDGEERIKNTLKELSDYKVALDESSIVAITDQRGIIKYTNDNFCRISRYSRNELLGQDHRIVNSGYHTSDFMSNLWRQISNGKIWKGEIKNKAKDGSVYWADTTIVPFLDDKRKPFQYVAICSDITEQKNAVEALRKSEQLYRNLFENILHGFAYFRVIFENNILVDCQYLAVNNEYILLTGLNAEPGKMLSELMPGKSFSDSGFVDLITRVTSSGKPEKFEAYVEPLKKWLAISLYCPEEGYFISLVDNISERKIAEEKIKKINIELEERVVLRTEQLKVKNEELEAFSYSISHDLRAPLRAIIGFTAILEEEYSPQLDDEARRLTGIIRSNTQKMGNLIDDLLAFSRVRRQNIEKYNIDTNALVEEVVASFDNSSTKIIDWVMHSLHSVKGDFITIRQVWINLISNAVKYSGLRTNQRIEIQSYQKGNDIVFEVRDNGVGFDQKYYNKLFKVFQRLHSSDEFEGTGVGLAIVEKIISKHGGKTWAEGVVDEGAAFYFSLPLDK